VRERRDADRLAVRIREPEVHHRDVDERAVAAAPPGIEQDGLAAACERIPKALPQMVVASAALGPEALSAIEDRAIAVGAVFLLLGDRPDYESMGRQLETGVALARERFGRRSSMPPS
jgi:hypothetical protein